MRNLDSNYFPELTTEYAKEGKTVVTYTLSNDSVGPKLDVLWVWSEPRNGCVTMDTSR